ncbi:hypothetical protein ACIQ1S_03670 [Streptomyces griseus]|uniref:hypothetical protein n=1 Tax=Streptomyces griseus TaxID=1911 RepID=UPI00382D2B57
MESYRVALDGDDAVAGGEGQTNLASLAPTRGDALAQRGEELRGERDREGALLAARYS